MTLDSSLMKRRNFMIACCTSKGNWNSKFAEENRMSLIGTDYRLAAEQGQYKTRPVSLSTNDI